MYARDGRVVLERHGLVEALPTVTRSPLSVISFRPDGFAY